jgi:hypothetical protein
MTSITMSNFSFHPPISTVGAGTNVTWLNQDAVVYTLWFTNASNGSTYLLSPPINPGAAWSHQFNSSVTLKYFDFDRLWINGTLTILPNSTVGGQVIRAYPRILVDYLSLIPITLIIVAGLVTIRKMNRKRTSSELLPL